MLTKPKKTLSNSQLEKKLWKAFSEYIRLRDSNENGYCKCFTCSNIRYYTDLDCGHGIPRQHRSTKYSEKNNHAQCKHCNGFEGGKREIYKTRMDEIYGKGTWDLLEVTSKKAHKWSRVEIICFTEFYKSEVEKLKRGKNLR